MSASQRHTERIRSLRAATAVLQQEAATLAVAGRYGELTLALKVQDGVVQLVRVTDERTHHVGRKAAA